ncbi:MAG: RNA-binding domain-containing protein [Candidatus Methylomirabilia bacterium]
MPSKEEIRVALKLLDGSSADALESEVLEFKAWEEDARTLHKMLREHVVCLANARGGTIVLGVRDHGRTRKEAIRGVGQYDPQVLRRSMYDGTDPHILVEVEELVEPEGTLLLVHVPKGMPPHTTSDGVARIRIGKECKPLTGRTFAQLMASGSQQDPTAAVVPGAIDADLDPAEIEKLRSVIRREAQNEELARLSSGLLVAALGLSSEEGVTLAGLLLLGKEEVLKRRVSQHEVVFLRFRGATRYDQRRDLKGPLLSLLGELEQLVSVNNRLVTVQEKNFGQLEFPDLSWEVAREAVLNAVTHRDYFLRQGVQVSLYRDRLEIVSPGGFIGGVTPKNVLRHPPIHRNELLARAFQAAGLVNRVGLGVDRIFENLLRMGKEAPLYSADEAHVRLVVPLQTDTRFALFVAQEERNKGRFELDDLLLLRRLTHASTLDRWSASEVLQLPEEEVAARLAHLREAGYLIVRGRGRSATYDLRRDLADRLRGRAAVNADLPLAEEAVRLRILALLKERGKLTNSEIRRFSGFSRTQVYRLVKGLEVEGKVRFTGGGRGAHLIPAGKAK